MTNNELLKQSLATIQSLKKKLNENQSSHEKIAVIGMACRFPGGCDSPEEYWKFLKDGRDAAVSIPKDRWDIDEYYDSVHGTPGKMYVKKANFLQRDISEFDAKFFRISPAEAKAMDPQQRQLLEVSWEALENAGENISGLSGSKTGVFIGINSSCEYAMLPRDNRKLNQYIGTGTTSSIASGRISYVFGFNGPTLSLDTACSSSLVSTLLAVDSLRKGACNLALSGGVNLMVSPTVMSSLCMMNALSESGKCAPFDASGDGYGRGEGCGILVLKRLSDAKRDGDNIYAVIDGGAVNNDGASSGLTVPNGNAQRMVIEDALKNCGCDANDISYLETHGTGTALGDPIEIKAIDEVFGGKNRKNPLILGAVKGNIGHLESAAGVASLIKVVLSLYHKEILPVANYEMPNPRMNLAQIPAVIPQGSKPWTNESGKVRIAGVSSFGFSGTNAHIIMEEFTDEQKKKREREKEESEVLAFSAKDKNTLLDLAGEYVEYFKDGKSGELADCCYTANTCRSQFAYRTAVSGNTKKEIVQKLNAFLKSHKDKQNEIQPITTNPKYAFFFAGSLNNQMEGVEYLRKRFKTFDAYWKKVIALLASEMGADLEEEIKNPEASDRKEIIKDVICFAAEYSMYALLKDAQICPEITTGAKAGAYIAAVSAGIMGIEDAVKLFAKQNINIQDIVLQKPKCRFVSAVKGTAVQEALSMDEAAGWMSSPVEYEKTLNYLYNEGYRYYIQIGCLDMELLKSKEEGIELISLFHAGRIDSEFVQAAEICFKHGTDINWNKIYDKDAYCKVLLPNYPFLKNRYWITPPSQDEADMGNAGMLYSKRGLDGRELVLPYKQKQFQYIFTLDNFKELMDNSGVVHLGYYLEMIQDTMGQIHKDTFYKIEKMDFASPIMVFDQEKKEVLLSYDALEDDKIEFVFYSRNIEEDTWQKNVYGIVSLEESLTQQILDIDAIKQRESEAIYSRNDFYDLLEGRGFCFGKTVKWVESVEDYKESCIVKFRLPEAYDGEINYKLTFHPGIIDSCAQTCNFLVPKERAENKRYMISSLKGISIWTIEHSMNIQADVSLSEYNQEKEELQCKLLIADEQGNPLVQMEEVKLKLFDEEKIWNITNTQTSSNRDKNRLDRNFLMKYSEASKDEKLKILTEYVKQILAVELDMDPNDIGSEENIDELGIDSMSGLSFYQDIVGALGVELSYVDLIQGGSCKGTAKELQPFLPGGRAFKEQKTQNTRQAYDKDLSVEKWIYEYHEKPKAKLRLFCFPYGFGSANMYKEWQSLLGDEIDVCAIKIPGLDIERMKEMPPSDIDSLMETLNQVLEEKMLDLPCASFGHSWGSLFAYRLAYRLSKNPKAEFVKCFVSGYTSPSLPNTSLMQILGELKKIGYDSIPSEEELRESNCLEQISLAFVSAWGQSVEYEEFAISGTKLSLPLIAAAYRLIERYKYNENEEFNIPIVGFHGLDDYRVSLEDMNAWDNITESSYKLYTVVGDHGFIDKSQSEARVLELIKEESSEYIE